MFEDQLRKVRNKQKELHLNDYVRGLTHVSHSDYEWKDEEMPDCTICLVSFNEVD